MENELPNAWQSIELEQAVDAILDYRGKSPNKTTSGVPLVTAKIVKGGRIGKPTEFIANDDYSAWMRRGLPKIGDVLLTTEAPLGEVAQIRDSRVALAQRLIALRGKTDTLDNTFLKFLLQSDNVQNELRSRSTGTTVVGIKQKELRKVVLQLPPIDEQRKIGEILGNLDNKIDFNRQMSRTLEAMARAIFKAWFVDFEPVKAKATGATSFRGMPQAIFDQLPDCFTETDLGPVPEGWQRRTLADVTNYLRRGISPKYTEKGGVRVINQRCIRDHWVDPIQSRQHDEDIKPVQGRELQPLDVLVNSTGVGTLGRVAQVLHLSEKTVVDSHVTVVRANLEEVLPEVIGYDLSYREDEIEMLGHGSTGQTELSSTRLGELPLSVAPIEVQEAFARVIRPINDKRAANWAESQSLAAIREALLPKLISGELRTNVAQGGGDGG